MKKLFSVLLAVILVIGLSSVAFAADDRIKKAIKPIDTNNSPDLYSISAGDKLVYPLTADMFEWSSGVTGGSNTPVTRSQISRGSVRTSITGSNTSAIKNASIKYMKAAVTNNLETAVVELEFVSPLISTSSKNFDANLFLQIGTRQPDSLIRVQGTMDNQSVIVDSGSRYVNLSGGKILDARATIRSMDIDLGNGVSLITNIFSGQKYYGYSTNEITSKDDAVLSRYSTITDIIRIYTVGLKKTGNYVDLSQYRTSSYIYSANGAYLGDGSKSLPYSDVYYISSRDLGNSISTGTSGGGSSSEDSSSSTSSSGGGGSSGGSAVISGTIVKSDVISPTKTAAQKAKNEGKKTAIVTVRNNAAITAEALKAMTSTAKEYGVGAQLNANTVVGKTVVGRVAINTANASKLTADTKLGVQIDNQSARKTKASFNKTFKNKIAVISLDQNDTFGMTVSIAAKLDLSNLNKNNLYFYSYNRSTNKYYRITQPSAKIDSAGYLHFSTSQAGDIIISDGALSK